MKILKKFILFVIISVTVFCQDAYVSSFNALRLGKNKKNYELTAKILSNFDLVGLIEVMDEEGVEKLVEKLQKTTKTKWDYHISPYPVGKTRYKEYFGYVWRKDRVKFLKPRGYYPDKEKIFSRQPYGADFKIDKVDFTMVLVHSIFGKSEKERRREAFKMDRVYDYFQNLDKKENDIIIAGDFNLSAFDEAFGNLLGHRDNIGYVLDPNIKTTLGHKKLASSYDNMFISKKYTKEFKGRSGALDFSKQNFEAMRKAVSDHLPIFIVLDSEMDDD